MTIGSSTKDNVQAAMHRFDLEMRDTPEWRNWEGDKNHKFAFISNGHRYPMKEIISLATGTPKANLAVAKRASGSPPNWDLRSRLFVCRQSLKSQ